MRAINHKLYRDLFHLRGQMTAIALVVVCGVASFVSMRSTYHSLLISQTTYYATYRFADLFAGLKRAPESLSEQISRVTGVATVQTRIVMDVLLDVPGLNEPATGRLVSVPARRTPMLNDIFIRRGRYIEPGRDDEVIASEAFMEANKLNLDDRINAIINGRWKQLRIVGIGLSPEYIYEVRGGDIFPDNKRFGVFWMSRETLEHAFDLDGAFNDLSLTLARDAKSEEVISKVDMLIARYGGLGAYDREVQVSNRFISDEISQNRISANILPGIFLGIAAFLIYIVMSRLVGTQREQIALLKAFGYGDTTIGLHYLQLALVPVILGTLAGTAVGLYLGYQLTSMYSLFYHFPRLQYEVKPELILITFLLSIGAASLGAVMAVRRAIALPPAEAMRPEAPPRFRTGLIERIGFHRLFSPSIRMVLRNLERRPMKAILSSFGVALAVAMLIVGFYFYDAVDYIVKIQFNLVQREDMTVLFNEVKPSRSRFDIQHLPGVMRSEPFRAVPIRIRFEHRMRRTSLLGLTTPSTLRHLVDKDLQEFDVPPDGVVLTTRLAEVLGAHLGDSVTIEVLEGERPVRQATVTGFVDELVGISVYMDIRSLNGMMKEGNAITGSYLSVDPNISPKLYSLLKRTPAVAGVSIKDAALASFNDIISKSLLIFTAVFTVFACIISFGIVYNGARIALSERGRELSSLRVLGFSRAEIAVMLLGEQAIITLVAIPLGFAIGFGICALLPVALNTDLFRIPLVVNFKSYLLSFAVVVTASFLSGLLVRWRLRTLDLIAVLKTRE